MSKPWEFTVEDFDNTPHGLMYPATCAAVANNLLKEWIASAPWVSAMSDRREWRYGWPSDESGDDGCAFRARIICIEPIVSESQERQLLREILKLAKISQRPGEYLIDPSPCAAFGKLATRISKLLEDE